MARWEMKRDPKDGSRRKFIQTVGASVPTLSLLVGGAQSIGSEGMLERTQFSATKFTPIDLSVYFNCSPADYGPQEQAKRLSGASGNDGMVRTPAGRQNFQGIPFVL